MSGLELRTYTVMPETRLDALSDLMGVAPSDGCFVQCGVGGGGSAAAMAVADITERTYYLFDSFEGMPKPGPVDGQKATDKWRQDWCRGDPKKVHEIFAKLALPDPTLVIGLIQNTLPATDTGPISILHLDVSPAEVDDAVRWVDAGPLDASLLNRLNGSFT